MDDVQNQPVKSLYKALRLLDYFDDKHPKRSVTELAQLTGQQKSCVSNMLRTFENCGFLRKHKSSGKYSLAPKVVHMYYLYMTTNEDTRVLQQECDLLCDKLDAIVHVSALVGDKIICMTSAQPLRYPTSVSIGRPLPAHCTAGGKAILAFLPAEDREALLTEPLQRYTDATITDRDALQKELDTIREQNYAVENMEFQKEMRSVSVPLHHQRTTTNRVRYTITVTMPYTKMPDEMIIELVRIIRDTHDSLWMAGKGMEG